MNQERKVYFNGNFVIEGEHCPCRLNSLTSSSLSSAALSPKRVR